MAVLASAQAPPLLAPAPPPTAVPGQQASGLAALEAQVALLKAQLANATNEVDVLKDAIRMVLQDRDRAERRSPPT